MNADDIYDPNLSVALSASAGSGKTFALTTRLITMLLNGVGPSEVLAITFTNLAANEIRRKLFDRLQAIVDGDGRETDVFSKIFKEKPEVIVKRAAALKHHTRQRTKSRPMLWRTWCTIVSQTCRAA